MNWRRRLRKHRAWFQPYFALRRGFRDIRSAWQPESVKRTRYFGHSFEYPSDSTIGRHIARRGEWDSVLRIVCEEFLPHGAPLVCDVGSNIGASLFQILAARPAARILAFEPSDRYRPFLERNVAMAGAKGVEVFSVCLGRSTTSAVLYNNETTASLHEGDYAEHVRRGSQQVTVSALDSLLTEDGPVELLKVDTDGYDFEVLRGAGAVLLRDRPVIFFELAPQLVTDPATELRWLQSVGYEDFLCVGPGQRPLWLGSTRNVDQAVDWSLGPGYSDIISYVDEPRRRQAAARLPSRITTRGAG